LWIWFAGTLAHNLRERGEGRVAATIIAAVAAFATIQLVGTALNAVLAYSVAGSGEAGVTKAFFDLTWTLDVIAALPSAVFFLAAPLGLTRLGIAVLFALRLTNWASDGFWSPTGEYVFVLIPLTLLWILVTSVILVRSATTAPTG
jgi:hypothetical protein